MNAQSAGDVALMDASIKKPGRFESPPFQFIEIAFNAFWITHARGYHEKQDVSLYYANISRYNPLPDMKIIAVLPTGTRLRITRLMKDQGAWGGVQVEAVLLDGTNAEKAVYLDPFLVAGNAWSRGPTSNTSWDADPNMLEKP